LQRVIKEKTKEKRKRNRRLLDRRSGEDRRGIYSIDYFAEGGRERRISGERRQRGERRVECVRVSDWSSVCLEKDFPR